MSEIVSYSAELSGDQDARVVDTMINPNSLLSTRQVYVVDKGPR